MKSAITCIFGCSATGLPDDTKENLAGLIGMTRTNVTLSLKKLSGLGLIEKKRGKIKIPKWKPLKIQQGRAEVKTQGFSSSSLASYNGGDSIRIL